MSAGTVVVHDKAAWLRESFDRSFERAPGLAAPGGENLLGITIAAHRYALRLSDLSGLFADKKVTWLPSRVPELLGIAGFRGTVLPVYDLGMLLGCPLAAAPRWLIVTAATPVGLAFEGFDGYLRASPDTIVPHAGGGPHLRECLQTAIARPIIHLPSVLQTIESRRGDDHQD